MSLVFSILSVLLLLLLSLYTITSYHIIKPITKLMVSNKFFEQQHLFLKTNDNDDFMNDIDYSSFSTLNEFNLEFISFNKKSREIKNRSYVANKKSFVMKTKFSSSDITTSGNSLLLSRWYFRYIIIAVSYFALPSIVELIRPYSDPHISQVTGVVLPGLGILLGTLISITYSILFTRMEKLQDFATRETSILSSVVDDINNLFFDDVELKKQCYIKVWDHADTLISRSRIEELYQMMSVTKDPLVGVSSIISKFRRNLKKAENEIDRYDEINDILIPSVRSSIKQLMELRSCRIGQESSSLPQIHFYILGLLSFFQTLGYVLVVASRANLQVISAIDNNIAIISTESRLLFSALIGIFTLALAFGLDLNEPFEGAYQIRKSSTSSYLIQVYCN